MGWGGQPAGLGDGEFLLEGGRDFLDAPEIAYRAAGGVAIGRDTVGDGRCGIGEAVAHLGQHPDLDLCRADKSGSQGCDVVLNRIAAWHGAVVEGGHVAGLSTTSNVCFLCRPHARPRPPPITQIVMD
ncbi:hypothetical protein GCM10010199_13490 [Dactylosporangium roseum]